MENIKKGRILRDTLFGHVRIGTAVLKTPVTASSSSASSSSSPAAAVTRQELVVVIKEYEKELVEKKKTRDGHSVNEDAKNELRLHALLCRDTNLCPHIVRLYDLRADATHYYAVLEYASKGEFFAFVSHANFTRQHARHFFRQLMIGVAYMHEHNIAHRDLSLENILLDENHIVKICDFGVACEAKVGQVVSKEEAGGPVGKLKYMVHTPNNNNKFEAACEIMADHRALTCMHLTPLLRCFSSSSFRPPRFSLVTLTMLVRPMCGPVV